MPDAWITAKVRLVLLTASGVPSARVDADTVDGRVTLHGLVASELEKDRAEAVVRQVEGARHVRNLLQVVPASERAQLAAVDAVLADDVSAALGADPMLADSEIEVASVHNGVVLLAGAASSLADARRAVEQVASRDGVRRVSSEIHSPDPLGDASAWHVDRINASAESSAKGRDRWITRVVQMLLVANTRIRRYDAQVDTEFGVVTLFGVVDSQALKDAAGEEVRKVDGVKGLVNELQVVAPELRKQVDARDASIESAVGARLSRAPRLRASEIEVDVVNGVARLTGTVDDRSDYFTALATVRATPGVRDIVDDLEVAFPPLSSTR